MNVGQTWEFCHLLILYNLNMKQNTHILKTKINENEYFEVNKSMFSELFETKSKDKIIVHSLFETIDSEFASSFSDFSFKIFTSSSLKNINEDFNSAACVIQNLINRGLNVKRYYPKSDSLILTFVLELFKRKYDCNNIVILVDANTSVSIQDTKKELIKYINIFAKLIHHFPKDLIIFINNITIVKSDKVKYISVWSKPLSKVIIEFEKIKMTKEHLPPSFISTNTLKYNELESNKDTLNQLLELVFHNKTTNIKQLKKEQLYSLGLILNKESNILAVLKTGFGKSLIYQFASILQPVIFLNVFPINSLIKDQSISMSDEINLKYAIDNEELKNIDSKYFHKKLLFTKRMFLITPERLENKEMQDYFLSLSKMIGFMIFDEAHCISEWGHDFRPAYLMARQVMETLTSSNSLKVIALTATAAPHIQKEIARLLDIDKKHIVNIADSYGLRRDEIRHIFTKYKINDFDDWNGSEKFANIINKHILKLRKKSKQGIVFFIKSGSFSDLTNSKYIKNINAFSAFKRLKNRTSVALYTGKNKFIEVFDKHIPSEQFNKFRKQDCIIATKSFGMGINLKQCDYVLLTEPPYSLEDLYQQAGRVGRMGQASIVEVLYHDRSLLDPLDEHSPYRFFLDVPKIRQNSQFKIINKLIKIIFIQKTNFTLILNKFLVNNTLQEQNYIKWAIAHLITEFKLIKKYHVKYGGGPFKLHSIGIFINSDIDASILLENINLMNKRLGILDKSKSIPSAMSKYYSYYFNKLQNDKIIGINILQNKLMNSKGNFSNDDIYEVLTDYYRTRVDAVDTLIEAVMNKMMKAATLSEILALFIFKEKTINNFELMEGISRYSSTMDYIEVASLMVNFLYKEKILVSSKKAILNKKYKNEHLESLRVNLIYKIYFTKQDSSKEFINQKKMLLEDKQWMKIHDLHLKKKILEELNE